MTVTGVLLVTGRRLRQGKWGEAKPGHPILRVFGIALVTAGAATLLCVGLAALLLPRLDAGGMSYDAMLVFKAVYSTVLASVIAPLALLNVLQR